MSIYSREIKTPPDASINSLCNAAPAKMLERYLGAPDLANKKVSAKVAPRIVTMDCGPFRATGFEPFLLIVKQVMYRIKRKNPDLYARIGTAGCLYVRTVRGGSNPSEHAWGVAIDLTIDGVLDERGDGETQEGLLLIYQEFKAFGQETGLSVYWGAEYRIEDSMHFGVSLETLGRWKRLKVI